MEIQFDRGDRDKPRGHALLYFRNKSDPDEVWVTYVVIMPISVDISKYVPPFLMNQVGDLNPKDLSAFAFPPAPELLGSYGTMNEIASLREDDIIYAGQIDSGNASLEMQSISEIVQSYAEAYFEVSGVTSTSQPTEPDKSDGAGVNEVLYGLMSDSDKLGELTKLVGSLRFAIDGSDVGKVKEVETDITVLTKYLPENLYIPRLVDAVKANGQYSNVLADLYLQRCYDLVDEDYAKVSEIETKIQELESGE